MAKANITDATRWRNARIRMNQKDLATIVRKMPKIMAKSTANQFLKLYQWHDTYIDDIKAILNEINKFAEQNYQDMLGFPTPLSENLSARGWHKDHNNYNKAEKHELPPSLRRTPARNVTKTGAKRKRATTVKKYKK